MRYVLAFLLGALLLIVAGLTLGYISLDFSAPGGPRLSLASPLAYRYCYEDECEEINDLYDRQVEAGSRLDELYDRALYGEEDENDPAYQAKVDAAGDRLDDLYDEELKTFDRADARYDNEQDIQDSPYWTDIHGGVDVVDEWYDISHETNRPWYVQAFPGFGQMAQQIIPGLQIFSPAYRTTPAPSPAPRPQQPQPSCWIAAQPTGVAYGGSSVLQWSSFYATEARLSDVGQVPLSGTRTIPNITAERMYSLMIVGPGGSSSCYTRIAVQPRELVPACVISVYPSVIRRGESANLAWGSQNASSATLSGVGQVSVRGGRYIAPQQSSEYTLTVYTPQGRSSSCVARITVNP